MSYPSDKPEAALYEAIYSLSQDSSEAFSLMRAVPDISSFSLSDAGVIGDVIDKSAEDVFSRYSDYLACFSRDAMPYSILFPESRYFPEEKGDYFPVIYASGNMKLLSSQRVTIIGMPRPSMQGKTDTAKAVSYFAEHGVTIAVPLDSGVGLLATKLALKAGAPVIAFLSTPLSGSESDEMMEIQAEIFANGLLLSIFPPFQKSERWHVMIRNRFIASVSSSVFLAEEKDGGPAWSIFDKVLLNGGRAMLSSSMLEVPSYKWARMRLESGALSYSSASDLRRIIPKAIHISEEPDLFS